MKIGVIDVLVDQKAIRIDHSDCAQRIVSLEKRIAVMRA